MTSPVVLRAGWERDWAALLEQLADGTGHPFRAQAAAEIIMLTHNEQLHEVNLGWHPKAEELLWHPAEQQAKRSNGGMWNVRYRNDRKAAGVATLTELIAAARPGSPCATRSESARAPRRAGRRYRRAGARTR
ncbi:hypothetical protein [Nocardia asteroides]|uniref:hypothetical protein n=1 Tax=Nocardia asteroides TaxID=1824 RepID=UPI001E510208|nr:hypothetical protein [Nocardia asteroides]UGT60315.1 hypothetical protein LTT61_24405 [Nocardia asteroides]